MTVTFFLVMKLKSLAGERSEISSFTHKKKLVHEMDKIKPTDTLFLQTALQHTLSTYFCAHGLNNTITLYK